MGKKIPAILSGYQIYLKGILLILIGCIPYAWSMVVINHVSTIPGSAIGISVICNVLFKTPIGVVNLLLNVPIMFIGTFFFGRKILLYTIVALAGTSFLIDWWVPLYASHMIGNPFVLTILGGILMGIGAGIILSTGASLAGTTMIGKLLILKFTRMKLGNVLIILDGMIICCGALLMHNVMALLYSAIYTIICTKIIDLIFYNLPKCVGYQSR
ncbi:MAG: YitT family protein [Clostridium sp.]|uniref:YitT family protein n=1 Tax=Lachnospiraceae TaxID=186803 RepID=UPI002A81075E|nr:YitT family protein [Hungatella effluvii]MCC8084528.1 YitT family protein [Clostridium sp.]